MDEVMSVNDVITNLRLEFEAKRAQLDAAAQAKRRIAAEIVAVVCAPADTHESLSRAAAALSSLIPRLESARESENELEMALARMVPSFATLNWNLEVAKQRAIPDVAGSWRDDVQVVHDGGDRFEESASVLRDTIFWHPEYTKTRVHAIPELPGRQQERRRVQVISDGTMRFEKSVSVLRGSKLEPMLTAYRLHVSRLKRMHRADAVDVAMDEVTSVNNVITNLHLAFQAKRAQLASSELAKW
uniref:Uncharacterized protein n=1 Tax=Oryza nivara TaxID=4536 RepID=A0A0E0JAU7_ORYNI